MAQRTQKEEMEFNPVPETIALCVKCGVAGICVANNLCQKCFNAAAAVSASASSTASPTSINRVVLGESSKSSSSSWSSLYRDSNLAETCANVEEKNSVEAAPRLKREVYRCSGCSRKVGLTGFRCRCGELFCSDHRYSDRHECNFDYKAFGRASIARENPVVKAAKIVKL